jgi:hypothetical protein
MLCSGPSARWHENEKLLVEIMYVFEESEETCGSPRIIKVAFPEILFMPGL